MPESKLAGKICRVFWLAVGFPCRLIVALSEKFELTIDEMADEEVRRISKWRR